MPLQNMPISYESWRELETISRISCSSLMVLYQVLDCWQPDCNIATHYEHDYDLMQASL
jgi:hypothetical protein